MGRPGIAPVRWRPPAPTARAGQRTGAHPWRPTRVVDVGAHNTEDVAVDHEGRLLTGIADGRVLRVDLDSGDVATVADTGGRPMGIEVLPDGRLVVCDANRGLLRVDPDAGSVEVLVAEVDGRPLRFCNNAAVAADGTVYFSDSSRRFGLDHNHADILEHSSTGRLLRRTPDGAVDVLVDRLAFANGVALPPDEAYVAVAETGAYRVTRHWLTGPGAGTTDVLLDNLPGFPDNLSTGTDGLLWLALILPRNRLLDLLLPRHPVLRHAVWAVPDPVRRRLEGTTTWVVAVDRDGSLVHDLQAAGEAYHTVTGVRERDGTLYLSSLAQHALAVAPVPVPAPPTSLDGNP
ncbi:MAG: SMP-30/gluconolactonase/LRE family protein [Streptosporangiales bacterium]|nr:SMP-30/gluconolactonase/LRE family protein [Streptosporangiales bacterium]